MPNNQIEQKFSTTRKVLLAVERFSSVFFFRFGRSAKEIHYSILLIVVKCDSYTSHRANEDHIFSFCIHNLIECISCETETEAAQRRKSERVRYTHGDSEL